MKEIQIALQGNEVHPHASVRSLAVFILKTSLTPDELNRDLFELIS